MRRIVGIYSITNRVNGKVYVGKSVDVKSRWAAHKSALKKETYSKKVCNRKLWADVQLHGIDNFEFAVLERFDKVCEDTLADREVFWMDKLGSFGGRGGYNLKRDSSTSVLVSESTKFKHRINGIGITNPNYGNRWTDEQKEAMRQNRQSRSDRYGDEWKKKISTKSKEMWADKEKLANMAGKVRKKLLKYNFIQMDKEGNVIRLWPDMRTLVQETGFAKQCVYAVCDGQKKTYRGFKWDKVLKSELLV